LSSRSIGSKCFQVSGAANGVKGAWTSFYSPKRNLLSYGVRGPDISIQETGYVQKRLLEPGLGIGYVRCRDLTRVRFERPDMSGLGVGYV
jgi:hypothetical protein